MKVKVLLETRESLATQIWTPSGSGQKGGKYAGEINERLVKGDGRRRPRHRLRH